MSGNTPFPGGINTWGTGRRRVTEDELEERANRYSELHGGDDEDDVEPRAGFLARVLKRLRNQQSS